MTPVFGFLTPTTVAVLAILGVIIFGRRLPEIGRSLGKAIVEFKKGVGGREDDLDGGANKPPQPPEEPPPAGVTSKLRPRGPSPGAARRS